MLLELTAFQIFFMSLSLIGLSFSILYLFVGAAPVSRPYTHENVVNLDEARRRQPAAHQFNNNTYNAYRIQNTNVRPAEPKAKVSKGRPNPGSPSYSVLEINYRVVEENDSTDQDFVTLVASNE